MAEYRAYLVGSDGHIIGFEPMVCDDDTKAVMEARRRVDGHDIELWCADRLVIRLDRKT